MIELRDVTVAFGRTLALDTVSLTFDGGITGLFGQNGSGKSTLLRLLAGLIHPTSGEVLIDGAAVELHREGFRGVVGFAGHGSGLYPDLTARENLELFARLHGVDEPEIDRVISGLALGTVAEKQVGTLSAGTKRRVAVARALVHRPRLLLLDEPYANLDQEASDLVGTAIQTWAESDVTAVVASHGAKRVKAYATAGVVLERGRVSTQGSYRERFERT